MMTKERETEREDSDMHLCYIVYVAILTTEAETLEDNSE